MSADASFIRWQSTVGLRGRDLSVDLLHLEHFLAVAEEGSFTRAAERVYRTQPAVSQSIKKLEDDIGVPLFARDMPELTLTQAGNALVDYARRMLKLRDDAMRQMESCTTSVRTVDDCRLRIGGRLPLPGPLRRTSVNSPGSRSASTAAVSKTSRGR